MKTHDAELQRIKDLLRDNPKGLKITRIAGELGMNRNAAAKYLEILLMTGQVEVFEHGMSKIFILSRRTGIPTMLDGSSDLILVLDAEGKIARVNDNYLRFAKKRPEDLLGRRVDTMALPVIGNPRVREKIRQAYFGEDVRMEDREIGGNGMERWFDIRVTPAVFNDGSRGIAISISDVSHEKRVHVLAEGESRTLVEGILSCIDDAVVLLDPWAGKILFLNPAACRMFGCGQDGYTPGDAGLLAGITEAVPGVAEKISDAFRLQGFYETEFRMKRSDGREFPGSLQLRPVYNRDGGILNIVVMIRDMSIPEGSGPAVAHETGKPLMPFPERSTPQIFRRNAHEVRSSG